jgi:hypothetical protein
MGASSIGIDRVAEAVGRVDADVVDDALGSNVKELHPPEFASSGLALEDRLLEQGGLCTRLVRQSPTQL